MEPYSMLLNSCAESICNVPGVVLSELDQDIDDEHRPELIPWMRHLMTSGQLPAGASPHDMFRIFRLVVNALPCHVLGADGEIVLNEICESAEWDCFNVTIVKDLPRSNQTCLQAWFRMP